MAYNKNTGAITAPISIYDVQQALDERSSDLGTLCKSSKINVYSWNKPVSYNTPFNFTFDDENYLNSMIVNKYLVGTKLPESYVYKKRNLPYGTEKSPFRLTDFNGYSSKAYPCLVDFSVIPDNFDFDKSSVNIPIADGNDPAHPNTWRAIVTEGTYDKWWYNSILIVVHKQGYPDRYYVTAGVRDKLSKFTLNLSEDKQARREFKSINIGELTCTLIGICVPDPHPDQMKEYFREVGDRDVHMFEYLVYPECFGNQPFKKNVKISTPKDRCYYSISIKDSGTLSTEYIPQNAQIYCSVIAANQPSSSDPNKVVIFDTQRFLRFSDILKLVIDGDDKGGIVGKGNFVFNENSNKTFVTFKVGDYHGPSGTHTPLLYSNYGFSTKYYPDYEFTELTFEIDNTDGGNIDIQLEAYYADLPPITPDPGA